MMDVAVKTLDGQNRNYSVPENITVKQFKEKIANSINIAADTQRLIFQGRVMQDDKLLKEYNVHGKVIHVVQRPPPGRQNNSSTTTEGATGTTGTGPRDINSIVVGSFSLPSDIMDPNQVQNIVQQAVSGMGDVGRNARVSTRASADGSSVDVHIHLGQIPGQVESESQLRINQARRMLQLASNNLDRLENPNQSNENRDEAQVSSTDQSASSPMDTADSQEARSESEAANENADTTSQSTAEATVTAESTNEEALSSDQPSSASQPDSQTTNGQGGQSARNQPRGPQRPHIRALAEILDEVHEVNRRLQPQLERYQQLMRDDPQLGDNEIQNPQRLSNMVHEILHAISHCYHNLSDLMIDMSQAPPRQLYAAFVSPVPTAIIQQTIPIHAQINVGSPSRVRRNAGTQSTVSTSSTATSTSTPSTNAASQTPASAVTSSSTTQTSIPIPGGPPGGPPQPGTTPQPTFNIPGLGVGGRAGVGMSTNPYTFLEVGPEHVTVNSISAHVVETEVPNTSASRTSSTTTGPQGTAGGISQDIIQGIVSSIMQAHMASMGGGPGNAANAAGGANTTTQSSTATTSSTSNVTNSASTQTAGEQQNNSGTQTSSAATSTSGTQTQSGQPRAAAFVMPGLPGMPGMAGLPSMGGIPGMPNIPGMPGGAMGQRPVDPYLPCSSRHFITQQARSLINPPAQQQQNQQQQQQDVVGNVVTNLMSGLLGQPNPHLQGQPRPQVPPTTAAGIPTAQFRGAQQSSTNLGQSAQRPTPAPNSGTNANVPLIGVGPGNPFAGLVSAGSIPGLPPGMAAMFNTFTSRPPGNTTGVSSNPSHAASGATPTGGPPQGEPEFIQALRNMLQTGIGQGQTPTQSATTVTSSSSSTSSSTPTTASSTTTSSSLPSSTTSAQPVMTDEAFTQLVRGISQFVTQAAVGQGSDQSISDFLSTLGENYNFSPGEGTGFINDVFNCVSSQLTFPDLVQVFFGNPAPLNIIRGPLQNFISQRVLNGQEPTTNNVRFAVNRLIDDMQEEIAAAARVSEVRETVNLPKTWTKFFRHQLEATVRMIMNADEHGEDFGRILYERIRRALSELIILTRSCLTGGMQGLEALIHDRLRYITNGINPMIQQWMVNVTTQQLTNFVPTINIREEDVHHYVCEVSSETSDNESAMETSSPSSSGEVPASVSPQSMEVQNHVADSTVKASKPTLNGIGAVSETTTVADAEPAGAVGGETWTTEVPSEWVPIIRQDVEKQKQQKPQTPLSDAYLTGMPAKRRKLMTQDRSMNLSNSSEAIPESLRRAVAAAGVEPISNMENLTNELSDNSELQTAFDEQVSSTISERLENDSDYRPERFPKTEEYFHKKSNKK